MSTTPLRIVVVVGSTRQGRLAPTVASWFASEAGSRDDLVLDVLDLAEVRLPEVLGAEPSPPVIDLRARLAAADAFVVVTPEYNHSFPAPLKHAIDWCSREWQAKPVAFVSYGGISGGLRAVEQLRQVLAELHAVTVRDTVSVHGIWSQVSPDGTLADDPYRTRAVRTMLGQLAWWARALKEARAKTPYAA